MATVLRTSIRPGDALARIGGDEFVVVCSRISADDARRLATRLVSRIAELGRDFEGLPVGASVGVAYNADVLDEPERMLGETDRALRTAKAEGKGRVVIREIEGAGRLTRAQPRHVECDASCDVKSAGTHLS